MGPDQLSSTLTGVPVSAWVKLSGSVASASSCCGLPHPSVSRQSPNLGGNERAVLQAPCFQ